MIYAYASKHAKKRIKQRSTMDYSQVAEVISFGGSVLVHKDFFDKEYHLIKDVDSGEVFVVVMCNRLGTIVTFMPLSYKRDGEQSNVDRLIITEETIKILHVNHENYLTNKNRKHLDSRQIHFFVQRDDCGYGFKKVCKCEGADFTTFGEMMNRGEFKEMFENGCKMQGIPPDNISAVMIKIGNNDPKPTIIDFDWSMYE